MRALVRRALTVVTSSLLVACSVVLGLDDLTGPGRTTGDAGTDGVTDAALDAGDGTASAVDGTAPGCPSGRGPSMVRIDLAGVSFCIDSTEVTRDQYTAFLES